MVSQLGAVAETTVVEWETSVGGDMLVMDVRAHRAHKQKAREMGRNDLPLAPLLVE